MFSSPYQTTDIRAYLEQSKNFPFLFQPRHPESHKGTYGTLAIAGGSSGMSGAVILAATAALYNGCGKVWAGFNQAALPLPVIPEHPEIMLATAKNLCSRNDINAWVVGCGLGLDGTAAELVKYFLTETTAPLILDADALTLLSHQPDWKKHPNRTNLVLTPHPAEAARLIGCTTAEVQADRRTAVLDIALKYDACVVLKGCNSLVYRDEEEIYTNTSGNPGLATAGSGDVLSGIIGSLCAQGFNAYQAACAGVWLHGAAADVLRDSEIGEVGMLAGEIPAAARWLRNRLIQHIQKQDSE